MRREGEGYSDTLPDARAATSGSMLLLYGRLFWHYRWVLAAGVLVAMLVTAIVHVLSPRYYEASALVLPPSASGDGGGAARLLSETTGGLVSQLLPVREPAERYLDILGNRRTLEAVVERCGLAAGDGAAAMDAARGRLQDAAEFTLTRGGLISIRVLDTSPERAAQIANAFVEALGRIEHELGISRASRERQFLEKRVAQAQQELTDTQEAWRAFQYEHRVIRVDEGLRATATVMGELEARRIAKEIELQVLSTVYSKDSPEVQMLATEVQRLAAKVSELSGNGQNSNHNWLFPAVEAVPVLALEQMELERRLAMHAKLYELLATQLELARVSEARERSNIEPVSLAVPPSAPVGLKLASKLVAAAVLTLAAFAALGLVVASDPALLRLALEGNACVGQ